MIELERYAVVSCHVERPLDDHAWSAFSKLQARRPGGFTIAALLRPPDETAGEDRAAWLERARSAHELGPLGHHTHWGGPGQARPLRGDPVELVRREAAWLQREGLKPTVFCGGGWYLDERVARLLAELGRADCTATAFRPSYLDDLAPRLSVREPCLLELPGGQRLLELPTTHSVGMLVRAGFRPRGLREPLVHAYFHDSDLLDRTRAAAVRAGIALLARRRRPIDLDSLIHLLASGDELPIIQAFGR